MSADTSPNTAHSPPELTEAEPANPDGEPVGGLSPVEALNVGPLEAVATDGGPTDLDAESASESGDETTASQPATASKDLVMAVDALGMTWSAYQLYPDPVETPSWLRAMDLFASSEAYPVFVEVTPDSFLTGVGAVDATVEGVNRIVRSLYVHEVSAISFPAPPLSGDLIRLFEVLRTETEEVARGGGVRALLTNAGVTSLEVVSRAPLEESTHHAEAGRHSAVKEILDGELDPSRLVRRVLDESGGDPDAATDRFTSWFEDVLGNVDSEDFVGREAVVNIFVEAFFHFDSEIRLSIIEFCLASRTKTAFETLLDQFSGHELAGMAGELSPTSQAELADYARTSADDGRPDELIGMLQSASEVDEARKAVAGRIAELLDDDEVAAGRGATFARLRAEIAAIPDSSGIGRRVLRNLLEIEERDPRFRRLLRIWTGKIGRAIHASELDDADLWLDAGLVDPSYPEQRAEEVAEALATMATDDLITSLVGHYEDGALPPLAIRLIDVWGTRVTRRLIDRLAEEEDSLRRRALIDILAAISAKDPSGVFAYLSDKRWYLVRNLAIALGKTGRPDVAPRLRNLATSHSDHRVRVEALRSLMPISTKQGLQAAIKGMRDDHKRVRQASVRLLAAADGAEVDGALAEALTDNEVSTEAKVRIIEVLGERRTPAAMASLDQLARRRSVLGSARTVRSAAREALKGTTE